MCSMSVPFFASVRVEEGKEAQRDRRCRGEKAMFVPILQNVCHLLPFSKQQLQNQPIKRLQIALAKRSMQITASSRTPQNDTPIAEMALQYNVRINTRIFILLFPIPCLVRLVCRAYPFAAHSFYTPRRQVPRFWPQHHWLVLLLPYEKALLQLNLL